LHDTLPVLTVAAAGRIALESSDRMWASTFLNLITNGPLPTSLPYATMAFDVLAVATCTNVKLFHVMLSMSAAVGPCKDTALRATTSFDSLRAPCGVPHRPLCVDEGVDEEVGADRAAQ
jgi:hypothetical protein